MSTPGEIPRPPKPTPAIFFRAFPCATAPNSTTGSTCSPNGLRRLLAGVLERLSATPTTVQPRSKHAQRWLSLDPLHEPAHRQLMRLYARTGQRSAALKQYLTCTRLLDEELGVEPLAETTALYQDIRDHPSASQPITVA